VPTATPVVGKPVALFDGREIFSHTDLVIPGILPIRFTRQYGYDALDRLTSATYPTALGLPASESFAYDAAGNREDPANSAAYDYDANNRITASPGKVWVYDGDGNPVSTNLGLGTEETFEHDASNRMQGYTNAATSTGASYLHDPSARRMKKSVNGTATWFLWDGDRLLAQFDASGDRQRRYTYTRGYTPAEQAVATGSTEAVQHLHADHLDTPRSLSSSSATVVWRAAYRAFGATAPDEDPDGDLSDVALAIRFPGQFADAESGLYDNRFRHYAPSLGRYVESDPLGLRAGQHTFAFAYSSPLRFTDPMGLESVDPREFYEDVRDVGFWDTWRGGVIDQETAMNAARRARLPGTAQDAYRHCVWACEMIKSVGTEHARVIAGNHERTGERRGQPPEERAMDEANNTEGFRCAIDPRPCSESCMDKLKGGQLTGLDGDPIPAPGGVAPTPPVGPPAPTGGTPK
jgi:RHS repeat-associated protein